MIRYLIKRPIAVIMIFLALLLGGLLSINKIPLSLLPNIDVPQIIIRIDYPNTSAPALEKNITRPIMENLATLYKLINIESRSLNHTASIYLTFDFNARMDLAYIEINEKLDRLLSSLPRDMERPQVIRLNTSDIPILRLQIVPKIDEDFLNVSALAEKILKKRIEQIKGVSLVDINGKRDEIIAVTPDESKLRALSLDKTVVEQTIRNANGYIGGLSLQDGQYRYFVKLLNTLQAPSDIEELPIQAGNGLIITLRQIATVSKEPEHIIGYHLFNSKPGIVFTIQKQPDSRMDVLVNEIEKTVNQFKNDYPQINFALTQNQSFLLDAGVSNLYQDIVFGGILTIALLFLFLGNLTSSIIMSVSIPLSLIITLIFFYIFGISFNIISLSGLALGIGMLIDNSIVVIDSITRKTKEGINVVESCIVGTTEVIVPVISQVLTTVAVYAPLILLSGEAGAMVYDQSIALTISLGVSLLVAFILSPLLYKLFFRRSSLSKEDTFIYAVTSKGYHKMIHHILKYKLFYFSLTVCIMPLGILFLNKIPLKVLPNIEKKESLVLMDWNDPIDAKENLRRIEKILLEIQPNCLRTESDVGVKQFLFQNESNSIQKSSLYYECKSEQDKIALDEKIKKWTSSHFPNATIDVTDAPNAFTQLFNSSSPYFEVRFKSDNDINYANFTHQLNTIIDKIADRGYILGEGMLTEKNIYITLNYEKMALYGVQKLTIQNMLNDLFGTPNISELNRFGIVTNIKLKNLKKDLEEKINVTIIGKNGVYFPLREFINIGFDQQQKSITADRSGQYISIIYDRNKSRNFDSLKSEISNLVIGKGITVDFVGQYFQEITRLRELFIIASIVLFFLYFILTIQYESLILPFIVMLTIPLGITGGILLLWITGNSLNIMSAVGFIVILGLIVDDPILKIEVLKRIEKKYNDQKATFDNKLLETMIHEAGDICLKPLLMVSLTTSIAMVPVLLLNGIGNELQRPMAIVIIGGLTIGTFFTTWFIPIAYWYLSKLRKIVKKW